MSTPSKPPVRDRAALADRAPTQPLRPEVVAEEVLIPLAAIDLGDEAYATRYQPRVDELVRELATDNQINAIHLRPRPDGKYQILAGFRRTTAATQLGWPHIRAIVHKDFTDEDAVRLAWKDNEQRQDLTPRDRAWTVARLLQGGRNQRTVAALLGTSEATVSRDAGWLELPTAVRRLVGEHGFTMRHAVVLVPHLRRAPNRDVTPLLQAYVQDPCSSATFSRRAAQYFRADMRRQPTGVRMEDQRLVVDEAKLDLGALGAAGRQALRQRLAALQARLDAFPEE